MVTFIRFGKKRRLVLMFEWLTLWPTWADLPVNSHRRDMAYLFASCAPANGEQLGILARLNRGPIMTQVGHVKFRNPGPSGHGSPIRCRDLTPGRASAK